MMREITETIERMVDERVAAKVGSLLAAFDLLAEQVEGIRNGKQRLSFQMEQASEPAAPTTPTRRFGGKGKLAAAITNVGKHHLHKLPKEFSEVDLQVLIRSLYPETGADRKTAHTFMGGLVYRRMVNRITSGTPGHDGSGRYTINKEKKK